ncbi:MAG: glycosyltransferase [Minisyncoccia bacterium]
MKVDICIPAYNEAPIIADTVRAVVAELGTTPNISWRIIVADNGSTDGTADAVKALAIPNVSVLSIKTKGKGAAVVAAAKASTADVFGFIDADLSADPSNIRYLLAVLSGADVVIGSRLLKEARVDRSWWRSLSSSLFNFARRRMLGIRVADTQCGLKLTNEKGRRELTACQEQGWFFDVEWLARASGSNLRIREIPISWTEQRFAGRRAKLDILADGMQSIGAFSRIRNRLKLEATRGA